MKVQPITVPTLELVTFHTCCNLHHSLFGTNERTSFSGCLAPGTFAELLVQKNSGLKKCKCEYALNITELLQLCTHSLVLAAVLFLEQSFSVQADLLQLMTELLELITLLLHPQLLIHQLLWQSHSTGLTQFTNDFVIKKLSSLHAVPLGVWPRSSCQW